MSMSLSDLRLTLANVVADPSKPTVQVVDARTDTDDKQNITGYRLTMLACKYKRNPVKLPATPENRALVERLNDMFHTQDIVEISLTNPVVKAYSMSSNGSNFSGVSVKADSFSIEDDDYILM